MIALLALAFAAEPPAAHTAHANTIADAVRAEGVSAIPRYMDFTPACTLMHKLDANITMEMCSEQLSTSLAARLKERPLMTDVHLTRVFEENGNTIAVLRGHADDALWLSELTLATVDGTPHLVEFMDYGGGEGMMSAMVFAMQSHLDGTTDATVVNTLTLAGQQEQWDAVLPVYETLAPELQQRGAVQFQRLRALHATGELETLEAALAEPHQSSSLDAPLALSRIDTHFLANDWDAVHEDIAVLEARIGSDAALEMLRASVDMEREAWREAYDHAAVMYALNPDYSNALALPLGIAAESQDPSIARDALLHVDPYDTVSIARSLENTSLFAWFAGTPEHEEQRAERRKRAGLAATPPPPPSPARLASVFRPTLRTRIGDTEAGTAFLATAPDGSPVVITARHLFGAAGGLSKELSGKLMRSKVKSMDLRPMSAEHGTAGVANKAMVLPTGEPGDACGYDVAVFAKLSGTDGEALPLATSGAAMGEELWVLSGTDGGAMLSAMVGSEGGCIYYEFEREQELQATSGAPVLNAKGEVVAVHLGGGQDGMTTFGRAIPIEVVRRAAGW